ncbi:hypothetical protein [Marinomonas sp. IMCC 4694]|nr:hypothetical protein [Marinomonas sp. IMCC 4694]
MTEITSTSLSKNARDRRFIDESKHIKKHLKLSDKPHYSTE